jgi:hypothetical protein
LPTRAIRTTAVGATEDAVSRIVSFEPAPELTTEPVVGVGACQAIVPASARAAVAGASAITVPIAANAIDRAKVLRLSPPILRLLPPKKRRSIQL